MKFLLSCILLINIAHAQDSCDADIHTEVDKFTGEKTFSTAVSDQAVMYKIVEKGLAKYYLSLTSYGNTAIGKRKGVYILFSDKTILNKTNVDVDCAVNSGSSSYTYTAFVPLSIQEVSLFSKKTITDFKLYIFEDSVGERNARELRCGTKILLSKR